LTAKTWVEGEDGGGTTGEGSDMTTTGTEDGRPTADDECPPVVMSRRIQAEAGAIFEILADPRRHTDLDGSGMLRGALTDSVVTGVGDVFVLKMYLERLGDYEMANHVVEFEVGRRITWEPQRHDIDLPHSGHRWGFELAPDGPGATVVTEIFDCSRWSPDDRVAIDFGRIWVEAMATTLERLDEQVSAGTGPTGGQADS
jgi:hypothetical protein